MYRERDPAGHLKHPAINEGVPRDEKAVAITQLVKTRIVKRIGLWVKILVRGENPVVRFTIHILLSAPDAVKKHSGECVTKFGSCPGRRSVKPFLKDRKSRYVERYHQLPPNLVSKCSWTHTSLSRLKKGIVTPWDRQF